MSHLTSLSVSFSIYNVGNKSSTCLGLLKDLTGCELLLGFPGGSVGKESACHARDASSIPGLGRSPEEGIDYPLQYSWASLVGQMAKESACNVGDLGSIPGLGRFPWRRAWPPTPVFLPGESPWTEEPGRLMGLQTVRHDWVTKQSTPLLLFVRVAFASGHQILAQPDSWPLWASVALSVEGE